MSRVPRLLVMSLIGTSLVAAAVAPGVEAQGSRTQTSSPAGNDIGWPQCGGAYPRGQAFGIVGLNDGLANTLNPCLASEPTWASASKGGTALPPAALYVNTADPGQVIAQIADWPTDNTDPQGVSEAPGSGVYADPYGACNGTDSAACSWQYGWNRAVQDLVWLMSTQGAGFSTVPSAYPWWLDVEAGNTWESGSDASLANNTADLEGMVDALRVVGGVQAVGAYSTSSQWGLITGGTSASTTLSGLPDWIPGARTQSGAQSNCSLPSFTGGPVLIAQWFGRYDGDVSCAG